MSARWPKDFLRRTIVLTAAYTARFPHSSPSPCSCRIHPSSPLTNLPPPLSQAAFVTIPFLLILLSRPGALPWSKGQFVLFVCLWASAAGATVCLLLQVRAAGEGTTSPFLVKTHPYCYQQAIFRLAWQWAGADSEGHGVTKGGPARGAGPLPFGGIRRRAADRKHSFPDTALPYPSRPAISVVMFVRKER